MTEIEPGSQAEPKAGSAGRGARSLLSGSRISLLAAAMVVVLALGALIWPGGEPRSLSGICLVYDPLGSERDADLYDPLVVFLARTSDRALHLRRVGTVDEFLRLAADGADFALCPDGLALALDQDAYAPLVAGRRTAPRNLRPRCVLVSRQTAGGDLRPWLSAPGRTIFGDTLSLCSTGILRAGAAGAARLPAGCASGPDPYDHGPVLHALRVGCFDHAVVRQWDAERFFAEGLLAGEEWGMEILGGPVPDLVLFASKEIPAAQRLELGTVLTQLGRTDHESEPPAVALERGLRSVHLAGFNLLVEPDLELVRSSYPGSWLPAAR